MITLAEQELQALGSRLAGIVIDDVDYGAAWIAPTVEAILAARLAEADARIDSLTIAVKAMGKRADGAEAHVLRLLAGIDDLQSVLSRAATTAKVLGRENRPLLDMLALVERLLTKDGQP